MFNPRILSKEMDYPHQLLLKNNYIDCIIKEPDKKPLNLIINPETGLEVKKTFLISVLYVPGLSE